MLPGTARRYWVQWLLLGIALLILGALIGYALYLEYRRVDAVERDRLQAQARVVDENLGRQLRGASNALAGVRDEFPPPVNKSIAKAASRYLKTLSDSMPGVRTMLVFDAEGTVLAASRDELIGLNFSEREYFTVPRERPDVAVLYVPPPFTTALGAFSINVVRVVTGSRGEFAGIVTATLDPEYFAVLLNSVRYTPEMRSSIIHGDGRIVVGEPDRKDLAGMDLAKPGSRYTKHVESGQATNIFTGVAFVSGDQRMSAWRTIRPAFLRMDKPFIVSVNRDMAGIFASWHRDVYVQGGLFGTMLLTTTLGLFFYQRRQIALDRIEASYETERSRATETQARLAAIVEHSNDAIVSFDLDHTILSWNAAAELLFGYSAAEVTGRKSSLIIPADNVAHVAQIRELLKNGISPSVYDTVRIGTGGRRIDVAVAVSPIKDLSGNMVGVSTMYRDISERKRAEETQARLAAIVEHSSDAIIGRAVDGTVTSWNAAAERILGYTAAEVIGRDPVEFVSPEERQRIAANRKLIRTGQLIPSREAVRIAKDGRHIDVTLSVSPIRGNSGNLIGTASIIRDITEQKQGENALRESERRYRGLFDNMLEGFAYCRMLFENGRPQDWVYVEVNPAFEKLTGLKNVAGKKVTEVIPGIRESNPSLFERYGRVASTGDPETFETYVGPLEMWFSVSAFCPEQGHFATMFEVITERKMAELKIRDYANNLRILSRKLITVQESERRFLARELHDEVGQTLTALKINLQVLGRQPATASVATTIEECVQIVGQALVQVRTLMLDLRPPQLDELGLAVALRVHAERQLKPAMLVLHFSAPDALPGISPEMEIVCFRIAQEALTNILRHAGAKNVWIDLAPDGGALCLTVRDDGNGFDYSAIRLHAARGGSIGLLSMEEHAALADGRIEFSTAPGAGTTVRVMFSLQVAQSTVAMA